MRESEETGCCGFLVEASGGSSWSAPLARPFRGVSLWLFGDTDAVLLELKIGATNQLVMPLPFAALHRPHTREFISLMIDPAADRTNMVNARCSPELQLDPHLMLPSAGPGQIVAVSWTGTATGVLLVGKQLQVLTFDRNVS